MAGSLTNYGESLSLNLMFRKTGTAPDALYLGLTTASFSETATLNDLSGIEILIGGLVVRRQVAFSAPAVGGDNRTAIKNTSDVAFGPWQVAAGSPVTHAFITDAASGTAGNIIAWMQLDEAKTPGAGDMLVFYANDLVFTLD